MFKSLKLKWIIGETNQSMEKPNGVKQTTNDRKKISRQPSRSQKAFYIQSKYSSTFEELVFEQKKQKGLSAPELAELALELLFDKFDVSTEQYKNK